MAFLHLALLLLACASDGTARRFERNSAMAWSANVEERAEEAEADVRLQRVNNEEPSGNFVWNPRNRQHQLSYQAALDAAAVGQRYQRALQLRAEDADREREFRQLVDQQLNRQKLQRSYMRPDIPNIANLPPELQQRISEHARFAPQSSTELKAAVTTYLANPTGARYPHISLWNTAKVTDMSKLFLGAPWFNEDLHGWNTAQVTDMSEMFAGTFGRQGLGSPTSYNQPLNSWNTAQVTDMSSMFRFNWIFNQPLESWSTVKVTDMHLMFMGARSFNQNINTWNTAKVTRMDMMFTSAQSFNQNINTWNTANVVNFQGMFVSAFSFNQNLNKWNVEQCRSSEWRDRRELGVKDIEKFRRSG